MKIKKASTIILGIIVTLAMFSLWMAPMVTQAAPDDQSVLTPTIDTYIDASRPDQNLDSGTAEGGLLFLNFGTDPGQIILLQFDLSGVPHTIDEARLNMSAIDDSTVCFLTYDAVPEINVYGTLTDFSSGVTWNTAPAIGSLLDDMDENPLSGHAHWTDLGADSLASYLEAERLGDGTASLWIELPGSFGDQVIFSDQENVGICTGGDLVPTLQLADSTGPLAVSLSDFGASQSNLFILWVGLGVMLVAIAALLIYRRRTASR